MTLESWHVKAALVAFALLLLLALAWAAEIRRDRRARREYQRWSRGGR